MSQLPKAIWEGVIKVFGVEVKCYTLDDGRRIIDAASMEKLITAMGKPHVNPHGDLKRLTDFTNGKQPS